jgi:hypothetical protein
MALTRPRAAQIYDIDYKQATRVVTVTNITLSGGAPNQVDGVNLSLKDRVLVTGQSTLSQNGIYFVSTVGSGSNGTWSRSTDTDTTGEILTGTIVMVTEGNTYADTQWKLITDGVITVGVTEQTWVQNYSANSISSGNSNIVVLTNANVLLSSAGTANVVDVFGTGVIITGTESVTGNITGANLNTSGQVSALGNVVAGNVLTDGLISATGNITGGNVSVSGNITANNFIGNISGNIDAAGSNTWVQFNDVGDILGATANFTFDKSTNQLTISNGNITGGNLSTSGLISSTGNITSGNMLTGGVVSATSNITGGNILTAGLISATGNVDADYLNANIYYATGFSASRIFSGNSEVNVVSSGGNVNVSIDGTSNVAVFASTGEYVTGLLSVTSNVTGGNILTGGLVSATGNILTAGFVSATGNITTDGYFLGNVACASGIFATKIFSGTTEANIVSANGNLAITVGNTSNVAVFSTAGEYINGLLSVSGNVIGGNLVTDAEVTATGNITGGNILGNGYNLSGINTFKTVAVTGQTSIVAANIDATLTLAAGNNISITTGANTVTIAYSASGGGSIFATGGDMGLIANPVTSSEDLGSVTTVADTSYDLGGLFITTTTNQLDVTGFSGNVNAANVNLTGLISAAGNITGNYFIGDGSQLTGVTATFPLVNGTSNINAVANGNITIGVGGTADVGLFTTNAFITNGNISLTGNIVDSEALWINTTANGNITLNANGSGQTLVTTGLSVTGAITSANDISLAGNIVDSGSLWINTTANGNITLNPTGTGQTFVSAGLSVGGNITSHAILETATITAAAPSAPTNFDIITQAVQYYTANANANVTVNFRGNATTTANVLLATGQSTTVALLWTNGATAYYPNVIQVDGSNVTPKWQGGTAVTAGNANAIDVYSFTIIKTSATPTYVVLGSQTKFA